MKTHKPHMWGFLPVIGTLLLCLIGCGIPDYVSLPSPVVLSQPTPTCLAFRTPSDVSNITGYILFYKIYADDSEFSTLNEEKWFDENTYISSNDEMDIGDIIPRRYGYIRVGEYGDSEINIPLLPDSGANRTVYIEFDNNSYGAAVTDDSELPVVGYDTRAPVTVTQTLARGIHDPTDNVGGVKELLSFVDDWDFDQNLTDDLYNDADLFHQSSLSSYGSIESIVTELSAGDLINPIVTELVMGFALCSYGFDTSSGLTILYSTPVFLGTVKYQGVNNANRTYPR